MEGDIVVRGIVLTAALYGEYDKRLVLLTDTLGRITVFANSARREKSPLKAVCQSFTMAKFRLRQGRNAYTLISAEIENSFREMALDMEKMCYGAYMCELMDFFTHEGVRAAAELNLLYVSFLALLDDRYDNRLIKTVFELKTLDIEGIGLHMGSCVISGDKENIHHIDYSLGGAVCDSCLKRARHPVRISAGALYTMRYILSSGISKVYNFKLEEHLLKEVSDLTTGYLKRNADREFKSLMILENITESM